jgi:hypothetical protein
MHTGLLVVCLAGLISSIARSSLEEKSKLARPKQGGMFSAWWWYRDASANVMVHKPAAREIVMLQAYPEELLVASICLACVPGFVEYGMPPENTVFSLSDQSFAPCFRGTEPLAP